MVKAGVRKDVNGNYIGVVKVYDSGRYMYSVSVPVCRLSRADAMADAKDVATEAMAVGYVSL